MNRGSVLLFAGTVACGPGGGREGESNEGSGIGSISQSGTDGETSATGGGTASGGSGSAENGSGSGQDGESAASQASQDDGIKFDMPAVPDIGGPGGCGGGGGGGGGYEFSYIWIANSSQGTVSKINTMTGVEEGRYATGPLAFPDPSRTSVNLYGDVAVVNRGGGIAKIATRPEDCPDTNGNGMADTSTGPADVKAWGQDECALWHTPLAASSSNGPRPVAWEGKVDEGGCPDPNPRVWVGHYGTGPGTNTGYFFRLDGATGAILDMAEVPGWSGQTWGPYGGAVDAEGNFWVVGWNAGPVVRIDADDLSVEYHSYAPGHWFYGMAMDKTGDVWIGGCDGNVYTFDDATDTFTNVGSAGGCLRGLQVDQDGYAWIAGNSPCRLVMVDTAAKTIVNSNVPLAGCSTPVGVSIDVEGYVWVVDQGGMAFKVDPDTQTVALTVGGLVGPYTYSDMTGAGLNLVVNPPG